MLSDYVTHSAKETQEKGALFAKSLLGRTVIALHGDLGSGKTTFVQGVAKAFGVNQPIISPTFILIREYDVSSTSIKKIYHIDLYRLEGEDASRGLGLEEIFEDKNAVVFVEWAEKAEKLLPKSAIHMYFEMVNGDERKIRIKTKG